MSEPEMSPLVDNPTYTDEYESFQELKEHCEATFDSLNFPLSWHIYDGASEGWGKWSTDESREFSILNFMARKGQTAQWSTSNFSRAEVEEWLDTFVKVKVMAWYGWGG